jgi:Tfp pilus assembly protein PilX
MKCTSLTDRVRRKAKEAAGAFGNQGAALITALLFLVILTMLGLAALMTSDTEMMISRNDRLNKLSLDYANAGVQEALARLDLQTGSLKMGNYTTKAVTANPASSWDFSSTDAGADPFLNFSGTVTYRLEDDLHKRGMYTGGVDDNQVVGYSKDCGYNKSPVADVNNAFPVYTVTSTGWVMTGNTIAASAKVIIEVSRNTINLDVPGALYSATCITGNGNVTIAGGTKPAYVTPCNSDPGGDGMDLSGAAANITGGSPVAGGAGPFPNLTGATTAATNFLGMSLDELKVMATTSNTYYEKVGATWSPTAPNPPWGDYANMKNPKIVYIDTKGGTYTMSGNTDNFGILIVKGDLVTSGTIKWKGLIYVTGNLSSGAGTVKVDGGVMVGGSSTTISGTIDINYDKTALDSVARQAFKTKILNWRRILN